MKAGAPLNAIHIADGCDWVLGDPFETRLRPLFRGSTGAPTELDSKLAFRHTHSTAEVFGGSDLQITNFTTGAPRAHVRLGLAAN